MELRHLRYFITVAETLNFSRAARILNIAQPPLSAQVRSLEAELGVELFERGPRGVTLTKAGRALLPAAQEALAAAARAAEAARDLATGRTGTVRLGLITPCATTEVAAALRDFNRAFPLVRLRVRHDNVETLRRLLMAGQIDVALTRPSQSDPRWRQQPLGTQEQVLALPEDHPWAKQRSIPIRKLQGAPLLLINSDSNPHYGQRLLGLCARHGVQPAIDHAAGDLAALVWLVSAGLGVAPYPGSLAATAPRGVVFRPLRPRVSGLEVALMWAAKGAPPATLEFVRFLRRVGFPGCSAIDRG
ncbi:MAG: LysR family transcriptional regulator [Opitutaceae bacterium]|nr:LysR family transcriptional regulator [Opitutaceae bacterium]